MNIFKDKDTYIPIDCHGFPGIDFHECILEISSNEIFEGSLHDQIWIEFLGVQDLNFPMILNIIPTKIDEIDNTPQNNTQKIEEKCLKIPDWLSLYLKTKSYRKINNQIQNQILIKIDKPTSNNTVIDNKINDCKIYLKIDDILNCWFKDNV